MRIALPTPLDPLAEALGVGDEEVVADELDPIADRVGELLPAVPVVLVERVLDGADRVALAPVAVELHHLRGVEPVSGRLVEDVAAVAVHLGGGDVEGEHDVLAGR
jgi:hypothetical protein